MRSKNFEKISKNKQKKRNKILLALVQVYKEFADESTIHGIKYTIQAKTAIERLFWFIILIISLVSAVKLASKFYERHESGNMRTTVVSDQYPSFKMPLPSITICHGSIVSIERTEQFLRKNTLKIPSGLTISDFKRGLKRLQELIYPYNNYPDDLGKLQEILDANNMKILDLIEEVSSKCMDELLMCMYEGKVVACDQLFIPMRTFYGICCSFNSVLLNENQISKKNSRYSFSFGTRYILSILMKSYNESDRMAGITYSGGYKVLIQDRYTIPGTTSINFMLASYFETIVGLNAKQLFTTPEVQAIAARQKKCRPSPKGHVYRLDNCYKKCRKLLIYDQCKCLHYFAFDLKESEFLCNLSHIPCLAKVIPMTYALSLHSLCNCLPECEGIDYTISLTGEPFNAVQFRPGKFYRKAQEHSNSTALHITFANQVSILEKKELILSWINLVSSLGGVFSLFLGCSFISIFEFLYFFFFQLVRKIYKIYKRNPTIINSE